MSLSSVRNYNNGYKKLSKKVSLEDVACEQEFLFCFFFRFENAGVAHTWPMMQVMMTFLLV